MNPSVSTAKRESAREGATALLGCGMVALLMLRLYEPKCRVAHSSRLYAMSGVAAEDGCAAFVVLRTKYRDPSLRSG
jgi:hypothetical protein